MGLIVLALFFVLMWVMFVVPNQRRVRAHQAFVSAIRAGDDVVTTAGVFGTVVEVAEDTVELEVADGVVLTVARGAIGRYQADLAPSPAPDEADGADELSDAD